MLDIPGSPGKTGKRADSQAEVLQPVNVDAFAESKKSDGEAKSAKCKARNCLCRDVACNVSYVRRSSEKITPGSVMAPQLVSFCDAINVE
jgi:hypothetical protein